MNVFFRELKANRKALIIWCICMFLGVASGMGKYTAYSAGGSSIELFNKMPYSLKALFKYVHRSAHFFVPWCGAGGTHQKPESIGFFICGNNVGLVRDSKNN